MHAKFFVGLAAGFCTCGIVGAQSVATPASDATSAVWTVSQFTKIDKDQDGYISREEAADHPALMKYFDDVDTNKDGKISRGEARDFLSVHGPEFREKAMAKFYSADKDGDGALTLDEAKSGNLTAMVKNFDQLDTNHDGKISPQELKAADKKIKQQINQ